MANATVQKRVIVVSFGDIRFFKVTYPRHVPHFGGEIEIVHNDCSFL